MNIFNRNISILEVVPKVVQFVTACTRACRLFEKPWHLISCYVRKQPLANDVLVMRSGNKLAVSNHAHDVVTIFVVFCKEDYGTDFSGNCVLDIGANIGIFTVCAALNGAKKIVSIEPSRDAYSTLEKNIELNSLGDVVTPLQFAVGRANHESIPFPVSASPYNQLDGDHTGVETTEVKTLTLKTVMDDWFDGNIDLLKMDCEGAEFEIFASTSSVELARICELKMEYHKDEYIDLLKRLNEENFETTFHQPGRKPSTGTVWLVNQAS